MSRLFAVLLIVNYIKQTVNKEIDMNWGDIYLNEAKPLTLWDKICGVLGIILFVVFLWGVMFVASAYEEHQLCMNGAIEHCIPEDFE